MISTALAYQLTTLRLRATRARLLLDLASKSDDGDIGDLLKFERALGGSARAGSVIAFRAAQAEQMQAAQAELARLTVGDVARPC